ncbi:MAG: hypothetical protein ACNA8W_00350 [Bradymonadaceae bacterium]
MKILLRTIIIALISVAFTAGCDKPAEEATTQAATVETAPAPTEAPAPVEEPDEDELGQWVTSETYGVKFRVPADWEVTQADGAVSTTAPDGTTTVVLVGTESQSMVDSFVADMKSAIELKDVRFEKSGMTTINGLPGMRGSGAAVLVQESGDQEIQFLAYALRVSSAKSITMMVFSQAEMYEAQKDIIDGIAQTIVKS